MTARRPDGPPHRARPSAHRLRRRPRRLARRGRALGRVRRRPPRGRAPAREVGALGIPDGRRPRGRRGAARRPRRPDAIVCANDEIAMGVLEAARAAGIAIPDDLAVTGWDDIPAARHLAPPLTTVRQPMLDLGRRAAELLRERISTHRIEPLHEVLTTEMVVRSSCGCASPNGRRRRMTKRRSSLAAVAALAMTFTLAACGRDDEEAAAASTAASQAAEVDFSAASGEIDVWAMGTEGENLGVFAENFMAEFPDVTVEVTAGPVGRRPRPDRERHRRRRGPGRQPDRDDLDGRVRLRWRARSDAGQHRSVDLLRGRLEHHRRRRRELRDPVVRRDAARSTTGPTSPKRAAPPARPRTGTS